MEAKWVVDRYQLYQLATANPGWSQKRLAEEVGYSLSWVKAWLKRLKGYSAEELIEITPYLSKSRAPKTRERKVSERVEKKILELRDHPPLNRTIGPKTILYYLHDCPTHNLKESGEYLPTSSSTVWAILDRNQRIHRYKRPKPEPEERPAPLTHWQFDFKSISTVPAEEGGKQQHVVEAFNVVDKGTSILLSAQPHAEYNAETVIDALIEAFLAHGLPHKMTCDRDPRFVGSWSAKEFPSPMMQLLMNLEIKLDVCPPHRPDKNAFVERYHRSYNEECLNVHRPGNLEETLDFTTQFQAHYNLERPNQALSCENRPPMVAWPEETWVKLPSLPTSIDPDHWLTIIHGKLFKRKVKTNGSIQIGNESYYISTKLQKQLVVLKVNGLEKQLEVYRERAHFKNLPIKRLMGGEMPFEDYLTLIKRAAVSAYRRTLRKAR